MTEEFLFLRDVLKFLKENNPNFYNSLFNSLTENNKYLLNDIVDKAEKRLLIVKYQLIISINIHFKCYFNY